MNDFGAMSVTKCLMFHTPQKCIKYSTLRFNLSHTSLCISRVMTLQALMERLHARANNAHASTSSRQSACPSPPRPFDHNELESYLDHFKSCKLLHVPFQYARTLRKSARVCKLHADYVLSFDGIYMVDICCGERIPYTDYMKLGQEERKCKSCMLGFADRIDIWDGHHIPGFRHIYLELEEAFRTSKRECSC
jgi:hypothetical protein